MAPAVSPSPSSRRHACPPPSLPVTQAGLASGRRAIEQRRCLFSPLQPAAAAAAGVAAAPAPQAGRAGAFLALCARGVNQFFSTVFSCCGLFFDSGSTFAVEHSAACLLSPLLSR
jgi:hypothetical protein